MLRPSQQDPCPQTTSRLRSCVPGPACLLRLQVATSTEGPAAQKLKAAILASGKKASKALPALYPLPPVGLFTGAAGCALTAPSPALLSMVPDLLP